MLDQKKRIEMQERGLDILSRHKGGFQFTSTFFPYTSGEIGPYYVQSGVILCYGEDFRNSINDLAVLAREALGKYRLGKFIIAGGETRDWIFSLPLARELGVPSVMIYKDGKTVGAEMKDKDVFLVADLNNEGSSPRDYWVPIVKKEGGHVKDYICFVDRLEGGVKVLEELGIRRQAIVPLDGHAWDYLRQKEVVSDEVYNQLKDRGTSEEERRAWAEKMLRSEQGLETLASLLSSQKTSERGKNIINVGYPQIKEEIVDRLKIKFGQGLIWRL